jgi:F-type H+-transporting ATPase subunit delta
MADEDRIVAGYAQAIFAVAEAEGDLDVVEDELFRFGRIVESQPDLREALTDPALPSERKRRVVDELLGTRASKNTVALLDFLLEQGRARDLPRIVQAVTHLAGGRRGNVMAEVRTAVPLDAQRRARLQDALSRATGKNVALRVIVDESVVGGVVARLGDQVFDGTVARKLEIAREQLTRAR